MSRVGGWLRAFGQFWWEFLIGDTPELFVATAVVIALAFALHKSTAAAVFVVLGVALASLSFSTWRGRKRV
jgi:hypothetical protein